MKNPANLAKHQSNPKVAPVIAKMMNKFGGPKQTVGRRDVTIYGPWDTKHLACFLSVLSSKACYSFLLSFVLTAMLCMYLTIYVGFLG